MRNSPDSQLIANYLSGDEKSLELLIEKHLKPVYRFVYRYVGNAQDAQDITQDAFVKAWRNLRKFDRQKSFKTWIFAIAKNTAIDFLKKRKAVSFSEFESKEKRNTLVESMADPSPLPHELFEKGAIAQMLTLAINRLSPRYRTVVLLRHTEELAFREIAESLQEPINTVKSRYRRALVLLRKSLES